MKESVLVRIILKYLGARNIVAWRSNTGASVYEHNGRRRFVRYGVRGSADIHAIDPNNGRIVCIECKSDKGKQSEDQFQFQLDIERSLGIYILAKDLDDVVRYFER